MTEGNQRIALFGGSFDPVHPGHVAVARAAVDQAGLNEVIFLPAARSPLKSHGPQASGRLRVEMLKTALAEIPWARVSNWELGRPGPSYSWETAQYFKKECGQPGTRWFWLLGVDQWEQLERWQNWQQLAADVTFLVFTRDGRVPRHRAGVQAVFLTGEFAGSSTAVRETRQRGGDWKMLVTPGVAEIVEREELYLPDKPDAGLELDGAADDCG